MDCEINLSKFKDIVDNIIRTEDDYHNSNLTLYYRVIPDKKDVMRIIRYLNCTSWNNFKFNQYSVKQRESDYIITLGYVRPTFFAK
jgi:hypothetical protein